jgi:tRNA threonylcarbamoyladenosine biosynthesis protein TsaB
MRLLVLDASLDRCLAALVEGGAVLALREAAGAHGQASALPPLVEAVLAEGPAPEGVAVCIGPGSFTGIRTALALGLGIAMARRIPCIPVSMGEALAAACGPGAPVWSILGDRRSRFYLEGAGPPMTLAEADLPRPDGLVRLAGDGAALAAARLLARGDRALLTALRRPEAEHLAAAALARQAGALAPREAAPLYVAPPATT